MKLPPTKSAPGRAVRSSAVVSTTVLPPDRIKEAMIKLYETLQACKQADWSQAPAATRMNAAVMSNQIDALVCCANDRTETPPTSGVRKPETL